MPHYNANKQYECHPERNSANLDFSKKNAG